MSTIFLLVIGLIVLAAVILILVVLVQNSKGGGLASTFSSSNNIMGVRKTTDFVEKATWGLAATIIVLSLVSTKLLPDRSGNGQSQIDLNTVAPMQQAPDVAAPQQKEAPAAQPQQQVPANMPQPQQ